MASVSQFPYAKAMAISAFEANILRDLYEGGLRGIIETNFPNRKDHAQFALLLKHDALRVESDSYNVSNETMTTLTGLMCQLALGSDKMTTDHLQRQLRLCVSLVCQEISTQHMHQILPVLEQLDRLSQMIPDSELAQQSLILQISEFLTTPNPLILKIRQHIEQQERCDSLTTTGSETELMEELTKLDTFSMELYADLQMLPSSSSVPLSSILPIEDDIDI